MPPIRTLLLVALLALTGFGQSIEVKPFKAEIAKSVQVEQLPDSVAVIFTDRVGSKTGAYLQVASDKKWATPILDGVEITQTKIAGQWILFAPPGKYRILLAEYDPETGPRYTYHSLTIEGTKPDDPVDPPPPPVSGFAALKKVAKEQADQLNDPEPRKALIAAYRSVASLSKPYAELVTSAKAARRLALQNRVGDSRMKAWDNWIAAVDAELNKVVTPGDSATYAAALNAIADALGS